MKRKNTKFILPAKISVEMKNESLSIQVKGAILFFELLAAILICFRINEIILWDWWIVFIPAYLPLLILLVIKNIK